MSSIAPKNHTRGKHTTDDWITPEWIINSVGPFDLDPCASKKQPWPCARIGMTEDGLITNLWEDLNNEKYFVWCNPPYGRTTAKWLEAMAQHDNGIALVFARTETEMFFDHVWPKASSMLFIAGRLTFHYPSGKVAPHNSGGPSVLIGYGGLGYWRLRMASHLGAFVGLRCPPKKSLDI